MGLVFSQLFTPNHLRGFQPDWDHLEPSQTDAAIYAEVQELLNQCPTCLTEVANYTNGAGLIREAMQAEPNTPESEHANTMAFEGLIPNAELCGNWQHLANSIATVFNEKLLTRLCVTMGDEEKVQTPPSESVVLSHQALAKQMLLLLDFALSFDQGKMMQSSIQNDFSFYRRVFNKVGYNYENLRVDMETAAIVSMFLAEATPFLKCISSKLTPNHVPTMGQMANACLDLLRGEKFPTGSANNRLALRGMVAAFIIFDHANIQGGFARRSLTRGVKICQMVGQEYQTRDQSEPIAELNGLKGLLKYGTAHFNDDSTPRGAIAALEDI